MIVTSIHLRSILDSRAELTVEAELWLDGEYAGRGSAARAIAPGRREQPRCGWARLGATPLPDPLSELVGERVDSQRGLDAELSRAVRARELGADVAVAVSLAHARALSTAERRPLALVLGELAGTQPSVPRLLVNVFSGGVHVPGPPSGFQQVMALPAAGSLVEDVEVACLVFATAESLCRRRFGPCRLSDSSGLLVPAGSVAQLELLEAAIDAAGCRTVCSIGVDVAAEHLVAEDGVYRFGDSVLDTDELSARLVELAEQYDMRYLEDPFDPEDVSAWRRLRESLGDGVVLAGDDLFASVADRMDSTLANSVVLKPTQVGTLTEVVEAAAAARAGAMLLVVSHRSGETEDTAIADLAVALRADLIKVGGPRRGDRLGNYNQLLRLAELVASRADAHSPATAKEVPCR